MQERLLNTLQNIENNFDPNNTEHLRDLLFIMVSNINILQNEDELINAQIAKLLDMAFSTKQNKNQIENEEKKPPYTQLFNTLIPLSRISLEI